MVNRLNFEKLIRKELIALVFLRQFFQRSLDGILSFPKSSLSFNFIHLLIRCLVVLLV